MRPSLRALFPERGLRRGSTVVTSGSNSLLLSLLAEASSEGSWCAVVGLPALGLVAAAEAGVELSRFVVVADPAAQWGTVTASLLEAFDIVVVHPPRHWRAADARRLSARARESGAVLIPAFAADDSSSVWPHPDMHLRAEAVEWSGLGQGHGRLVRQNVRLVASGRGAASRERQASFSLMAS